MNIKANFDHVFYKGILTIALSVMLIIMPDVLSSYNITLRHGEFLSDLGIFFMGMGVFICCTTWNIKNPQNDK